MVCVAASFEMDAVAHCMIVTIAAADKSKQDDNNNIASSSFAAGWYVRLLRLYIIKPCNLYAIEGLAHTHRRHENILNIKKFLITHIELSNTHFCTDAG